MKQNIPIKQIFPKLSVHLCSYQKIGDSREGLYLLASYRMRYHSADVPMHVSEIFSYFLIEYFICMNVLLAFMEMQHGYSL